MNPLPTDPGALREEALGRLERFTKGESGYTVYPGGIFMTDGPSPFYDDLRLLLAHVASLRSALERATDTVGDLRRRQKACTKLGRQRLAGTYGKASVIGKAKGYAHSAELLSTALSSQQDKP